MKSHLSNSEPSGKSNCLCGSGLKFKNCCKSEYPKKKFNATSLFDAGDYKSALKSVRQQITWYRLCHLAHTVPFLMSNSIESKKLLKTDINALSEMTDLLMACQKKCNKFDDFPKALDALESAINDDLWRLKIDYHRCIYFYVYKNDIESSLKILKKYDWKNLIDVDLLTVYLDIKAGTFNQAEKISIAQKIHGLTDSPSTKLQYGSMVGIEYCLLNDVKKGISLIEKAIKEFEETPNEKSSAIGRHHLAFSYKYLGELTPNKEHLIKSAQLLASEINHGGYSDLGLARLWFDLGECYYNLGDFKRSLNSFNMSLDLDPSDLTRVFKSRALINLSDINQARNLLNDVDLEGLSEPGYFDYAISQCNLAIHTLESSDINEGLNLIKGITTNDPYFKDVAQSLLVQLYEMKNTDNGVEKAESALMKLNKYVSLKPNVFGIGIDLNAIIEDIVK